MTTHILTRSLYLHKLVLIGDIYHIYNESYTYLSHYNFHSKVRVKFPLLEKKIQEQMGGAGGLTAKALASRNDDWLECRSDESNKSDCDYKYEEDPENMVVKKYKKQK